MDAFISGAWRTLKRAEVVIGGQFRRLTRIEAYINGQWRSVAKFLSPLTVSANNVNGYSYGTTYVSNYSTATPNGGLGPYRYQWTRTSGTVNLSTANQATATFSATVPYYQGAYATATVTCTDSLGNVASANITVYLYSERDTGNQ